MNVVVEEWVRKAEGDFRTAGRELGTSKVTSHDSDSMGADNGTGFDCPAAAALPARDSDSYVGVPSDAQPLALRAVASLRHCVNRGCPFGDDAWQDQMVKELGLESTMRDPGRPGNVGPAGKGG